MTPSNRHLVVDGSNIATEGRTVPSLAQLDEAVRAAQAERPGWTVTVIVDATFAHRIDSSERPTFEDANNNGEITVPPAGAVGRGDAFILQVADKAGAAVLSNDSFQEFHGEHPWLFDEGRLVGGKPVEGIGWVFVPRIPVRGPASRKATRGTKSTKSSSRRSPRRSSTTASGPPPKPTDATPPPKTRSNRRSSESDDRRKKDRRNDDADRRKKSSGKSTSATKKTKGQKKANADKPKATDKKTADRKQQEQRSGKRQVDELNSARDFMMFVTKHSIGDEVTAVVDRFSSHGCYLKASSAQCYLPSSAMGDPPPTRARDVVSGGQTIIVRVESIDSDRRGINVSLVRTVGEDGAKQAIPADKGRGVKPTTSQLMATTADQSAGEANPTRSTTTVATKKSVKRARKRPAKKATKKSTAKATTSSRATKAAARRTASKKATKKATAKKTAKKATKKATAKKTAKKTTKKATAKKATAKKTAKKATKKR